MATKAPLKPIPAVFKHEKVAYWLKNINTANTREAYRNDLIDFVIFAKIKNIEDFKKLKRADIIDWRDSMKGNPKNPNLAIRSIKRKMSTVSKFFEYLCDENVLESNVVIGVERPKLQANEGATAAINDHQARALLEAPDGNTLKDKRDRAILATFLFHGLRRSELCKLKVKDIEEREGIKQFKILGKGDKIRYIPVAPVAIRKIEEYFNEAGHKKDLEAPLFHSLSNNSKNQDKHMTPIAIYDIVKRYGAKVGIDVNNFSPHSLRSTAATNTLRNGEDLRKVQQWLGHANISTTALYDKSDSQPEDSPTFRVRY